MERQKVIVSVFIIVLLISSGCEIFSSDEGDEAKVVRRDDKIFIEDRTGKDWDVTHAASKYGFVPEQFQFGLGPFAIPPILNPQMVGQGESGYPANSNESQVIGTTINGDTRAYPLDVLSRHEIADENFDSTYVAVAY
jgi:hypothetical protein